MKRFVSIMLVLCVFMTPVYASAQTTESEIMPRWAVMTNVTNRFYISGTGTATVTANYIASTDSLQSIRIETKIQKRFLLVLWNDVDGGQWTDSFTTTIGSFTHTLQLSKTGTYRAVFSVYAVGADGSVDDFELTKEYVYE